MHLTQSQHTYNTSPHPTPFWLTLLPSTPNSSNILHVRPPNTAFHTLRYHQYINPSHFDIATSPYLRLHFVKPSRLDLWLPQYSTPSFSHSFSLPHSHIHSIYLTNPILMLTNTDIYSFLITNIYQYMLNAITFKHANTHKGINNIAWDLITSRTRYSPSSSLLRISLVRRSPRLIFFVLFQVETPQWIVWLVLFSVIVILRGIFSSR